MDCTQNKLYHLKAEEKAFKEIIFNLPFYMHYTWYSNPLLTIQLLWLSPLAFSLFSFKSKIIFKKKK